MRNCKKTLLLGCLMTAALTCHAGVFVLSGTVDGQSTVTYSWDSIETAIDALGDDQLKALLPGYTGVEAVNLSLNLRGEMAYLAFPSATSTTLVFSLPSLGITQSFTGGTRAESQQLWEDYMKNNTALLEGLMRQLVKTSPIDPIAGNPNSLMTRAVQQDYEVMLRNVAASGTGGGASQNRLGSGLTYSSMTSAGVKSRSVTLPLSYARTFGDPNHEFSIHMPVTLTKVGSAKVYETNLSSYYRHPLTPSWVLGGQLGLRATGSQDLGSLAVLGGSSAMSSYTWGESWQLTMGNLVGRNQTLTVKSGGDAYNPRIGNNVYRNGFLLSTPGAGDALGVLTNWEFFWVDTRFAGTELYNRWQEEVGMTYGTRRLANAREADLRGGFTYVKAEKAHGFRCNIGVWF